MEQKTPGTPRRVGGPPATCGRRAVRWTLASAVILLSLGALHVHVAAAQPNTVATVGTDRLALRRGPGKDFPAFHTLKAGTKVEIEELEGEWARVITPAGQRGYVHSNFLQIPGEPAPETVAPAPESARPTPTATAKPTAPPKPTATTKPAATATATTRPRPTATAPRPTEPRRPPTPTPTPKKPTATLTPTPRRKGPAAEATAANDRARQMTEELSALTARNASLEAELRATRESVAAAEAKSGSPGPGRATDLSTEIARLTMLVETLRKQLELRDAGGPATGTAVADADVRQGLSGTTVGAGVLGIAIGWLLGTVLGRRSDRSRRNRIRF